MRRIGYFFLYFMSIGCSIVSNRPAIMVIHLLLKDNKEIFAGSPFALPSEFRWENYLKVWDGGIGIYFFNSVWITR